MASGIPAQQVEVVSLHITMTNAFGIVFKLLFASIIIGIPIGIVIGFFMLIFSSAS